ncbi:MAG TPA: DUF6084 family protein, partial [Kofleriaceae bacterium]|nr:DUF6084 family protein [Kofleriaceae bacterium]
IALRCQIRIEPQRRRYTPTEEERLAELFGDTARWGDTLRPFLWTHVTTIVSGFTGATEVELPVPVTYDLEVAASNYFQALEGGDIPALFLFSGTVFLRGSAGLRVEQVPWDKEVSHRLPMQVWRDLMDAYFPGCGWLRLRRETLDGLQRAKVRRALASWDDVMVALMRDAGDTAGDAR